MLLLSGLIGAMSGALITLVFNMWKFHRDERSSRCDELCKAISDAATAASAYWFRDYRDAGEYAQEIDEARLFASQILIDGLFSSFRIYLVPSSEESIDRHLSSLYDAFTGGDYSVPGRPVDLERGKMAATEASIVNVEIRRAHRETLPFNGLAVVYHNNRRRALDMPPGFGTGCQ